MFATVGNIVVMLAVTFISLLAIKINFTVGYIKDETAFDRINKINSKIPSSKHLHEGDIHIEEGDPTHPKGHYWKKTAVQDRRRLWPGKIVPYEFNDDMKANEWYVMLDAMDEIASQSCVKFVEHTYQKDYIRFTKRNGCYSTVGRVFWVEGAQDVGMGEGCDEKGIVMHELLHALGMHHEVSRYDRDDYVEIMWENILPGKEHNFEKVSYTDRTDHLIEYDINSLMHYGPNAFTKHDGLKTIVAVGDPHRLIGNRHSMSAKDVVELNLLYDCHNRQPDHIWSAWSSYSRCNEDCKKHRQRFCASKDIRLCANKTKSGVQTESSECSSEECYAPIDGHWARWSSWSACSVTCGIGTRLRKRSCTDPPPKNGGRACDKGAPGDVKKCMAKNKCPLKANQTRSWSEWSSWSGCSSSCTSTRSRVCFYGDCEKAASSEGRNCFYFPCVREKKIGCFKDLPTERIFSRFENLRPYINWYENNIVVDMCREIAMENHSKYFGIEFFGECWYGQTEKHRYNLHGPSNDCREDVGTEWSVVVYETII